MWPVTVLSQSWQIPSRQHSCAKRAESGEPHHIQTRNTMWWKTGLLKIRVVSMLCKKTKGVLTSRQIVTMWSLVIHLGSTEYHQLQGNFFQDGLKILRKTKFLEDLEEMFALWYMYSVVCNWLKFSTVKLCATRFKTPRHFLSFIYVEHVYWLDFFYLISNFFKGWT